MTKLPNDWRQAVDNSCGAPQVYYWNIFTRKAVLSLAEVYGLPPPPPGPPPPLDIPPPPGPPPLQASPGLDVSSVESARRRGDTGESLSKESSSIRVQISPKTATQSAGPNALTSSEP